MKARLIISGLVALACVSVLAAGDTYSMTYQSTATSHAVTTPIISFAIARSVQPGGPGGPTSGARPHQVTAVNAGQIKMEVGRKLSELAGTFKKGATFSKMTIVLSGTTPAGATAQMRHWTITDSVIDSYAVSGAGPNAQATINLHWNSIALASP